ncbi:bacteriophage abortive infection AbiH family protein [Lactonifactor longoviformis]|uniref:AbiH family protein n=1 Tax=Lactonifactor longoviformis TaxID=341220 RepID=UPI00210C9203|nr:AbiH family protein [Lactonifactor longoviformis]MCQ4672657.1 bacteriophage abortive infection AbiH family protein [Lactonifactor longoviformis]
MSKLFIIGNGFDSAHKMPSSYEKFRKYIISDYELSEHEEGIPEIPDIPNARWWRIH